MINERIALIMLEGEIPPSRMPDHHHRKQLYKSILNFADASVKLCECGRTNKFEEYLKVAFRLFTDGNEAVRNAIIKVYLYTVSRALEQKPELNSRITKLFPEALIGCDGSAA